VQHLWEKTMSASQKNKMSASQKNDECLKCQAPLEKMMSTSGKNDKCWAAAQKSTNKKNNNQHKPKTIINLPLE